jgi:NADPH:quinone reductase-like Zn-dependent oxidoreductase
VKGDLLLNIPNDVSFEAAATSGVGVLTVGYALYKVLEILFPGSGLVGNDKIVLIYEGTTATGTLAIQLSKL